MFHSCTNYLMWLHVGVVVSIHLSACMDIWYCEPTVQHARQIKKYGNELYGNNQQDATVYYNIAVKRPATTDVCKTRSCNYSFWAPDDEMCHLKHVEPLINTGIINYSKQLHLVGYFHIIYTMMHGSTNIKNIKHGNDLMDSKKASDFLTSWATISFSRALLHCISKRQKPVHYKLYSTSRKIVAFPIVRTHFTPNWYRAWNTDNVNICDFSLRCF